MCSAPLKGLIGAISLLPKEENGPSTTFLLRHIPEKKGSLICTFGRYSLDFSNSI
jgi:hypothetical protein